MEKDLSDFKREKQTRSLTTKAAVIDEATRTVELAFSSEEPYGRVFGIEILDHGTESIRLGRLMDGAPLLLNHDSDKQIGVVETVQLGDDRVARARVRFGKGALASEVYQDVIDGIRRKVSVGYMIHGMVLDSKSDDQEVYRVTDWEPYEVSIVPIPADSSVGVGRSADQPQPTKESKMDKIETPPVDVQAVRNEALATERKRIADLTAVGAKFPELGGADLAQKAIAEGKSVEDLNAMLLERTGAKKATQTAGDIGLTEREVQTFSFLRLINAIANPQDRKAQENAKFELEASAAAQAKTGRESRGVTIPMDVLRAPINPKLSKRDLEYGNFANGGAAVETSLLTGSFIDALRNRLITQAAGAQVLTGLTGEIAIPRQTGVSQAYWVGEGASPTESQPALGQIRMTPRTVGAFTDLTRRVLTQTSMDMEAFARNDIVLQMALEIDRAVMYGTGSNGEPLGLRNTTGVQTQTVSVAGQPTFAELIGFETKIAQQNADFGTLCYVTTPGVRGFMKGQPKVTNQAVFLWDGGANPVNGYRAEVSQQIASNEIWFGNWADLVIGMYSGLDLMVDPYTFSTSGTVRIAALQDLDVAVRRPVSFCRSA